MCTKLDIYVFIPLILRQVTGQDVEKTITCTTQCQGNRTVIISFHYAQTCWEKNMFDDIKSIIRRCKSKNVREYNNQEKRAKIGKQCSAKEAQKSKKT